MGIGWSPVEYEALGQAFRTRGTRYEEQIGLLRRLFTEPVVDFTGRFDRVDRAALVPRPKRSIPSWPAGSARRLSTERPASRTASSFVGGGIDHSIDVWISLRERVRDQGRPVVKFGADYVVPLQNGCDPGSDIEAWGQAGITHVSLLTMGVGLSSVDAHIDRFAVLAKALDLSAASHH